MTRLQGLIGRVIVPRNPQPSPLQLGYEDDGYGDNGYTSHDDGTDDQCKDVGAAWLVLVVQHAKAPSRQAFQPIPSTPGVNGLPILTTDYQNPGFDTSDDLGQSALQWQEVARKRNTPLRVDPCVRPDA